MLTSREARAPRGVRGNGYRMLAMRGDPSFAKAVKAGPSAFETSPTDRDRYIALAVALYPRDDLKDMGRKRIAAWNAEEHRVKMAYTGGEDFSMANPWHPCLGQEALLGRLGWLAYMTRWDPGTYAAQFAAEWSMAPEYAEFCGQTIHTLSESLRTQPQRRGAVERQAEQLRFLAQLFGQMGAITTPRAEALLIAQPEASSKGFAHVHYLAQAKQCIELLGGFTPAKTRAQLERLEKANQPLLAEFARERLRAAQQAPVPCPPQAPHCFWLSNRKASNDGGMERRETVGVLDHVRRGLPGAAGIRGAGAPGVRDSGPRGTGSVAGGCDA